MGSATSTKSYSYGNSNWGDLLTGYNGNTVSSDAIGNILSDGKRTYAWEHGRELATVAYNGSTWTNTYDADGMRTARTNGSTAYSYVYNGGSLSQMTVGGNTLYFAYDASGTPLSVTYNGTAYYYATNLQGDVTAILNTSGTAVVTYTYDAWGNILTTGGSMASTLGTHNPLRYRGYVYDTETGLYYLQSRYYDPEMGRFLNADTFVHTGQGLFGCNMFAYCNNNPVNNMDTVGTTATDAINSGLGGLLGLLTLLDGLTPIMEIVAVIAGLISVATLVADSITKEEEKTNAITDSLVSEPETPALYVGVDLYGGSMRTVTGPMLFDDAADWAIMTAASGRYSSRASWGLITLKREDAMAMAMYLGAPGPVSFDEIRRNHLPHFHTGNRIIIDDTWQGHCAQSFHVWYTNY